MPELSPSRPDRHRDRLFHAAEGSARYGAYVLPALQTPASMEIVRWVDQGQSAGIDALECDSGLRLTPACALSIADRGRRLLVPRQQPPAQQAHGLDQAEPERS